jgi:hypothetical protein
MESVRNFTPFEILCFRAIDAAGSPGGVSRFQLYADNGQGEDAAGRAGGIP